MIILIGLRLSKLAMGDPWDIQTHVRGRRGNREEFTPYFKAINRS